MAIYAGTDASGNGNNFQAYNIDHANTNSYTYDVMVDVPGIAAVSSQADIGGVIRGNYCTLNILDYATADPTAGALSLTNGFARATMAIPSTGKWYYESYCQTVSNNSVGLSPASSTNTNANGSTGFWAYIYNGNKYEAGNASSYGASFTSGDRIGVAIDSDAGTVTYYKNNVSQGIAHRLDFKNTEWLPLSRPITSSTSHLNFGQQPFYYTPPAGHKSLCTTNLPNPVIKRPSDHFDVKTYTGNGTALTIGGAAKQTTTYPIGRSVGFSNTNTYLNKNFNSSGNTKTWTWSGWLKFNKTDPGMFFAAGNSSVRTILGAYGSGKITFLTYSSYNISLSSDALFTRTDCWYHVVLAVDTTQPALSTGIRLWVNGVRQPMSGTYTQNATTYINNASYSHNLGRNTSPGNYYDGYMSDVRFIDGESVDISEFGQFDANNNWVPKEYTGSYGQNGFYLPLNDASRSDSGQWMPLTFGPGLGNWTIVNKFNQIPAGTVVKSIGYYNNSADTGSQYYIVRYDGGTSYTKVAQTDIGNHPGTGLIYRALSGGDYTIPSTGTYYLAAWCPGSGLNWGHDTNSSTSWHYYNGSINSVSGSTAWTAYSSSYKEPALLWSTNTGLTKDASGNLNTWENQINENSLRANDGSYDITVTENDGTTAPTNTNNGAFGSIAINNTHSSLPSASNEYLIVTISPAKPVTQELKFYFDVNPTWKNGRNLYINGTEVNTANVTNRTWNSMQEWTIDLAAEGITELSSFTTPQNSGGRCSLFSVVIDGNVLIESKYSDTLLDVPTDSIDASGNISGNYAVIDANSKSADATVSNNNLSVYYSTSASPTITYTTLGASSGKWYWENTVVQTSIAGVTSFCGVVEKQYLRTSNAYPGQGVGYSYYGNLGNIYGEGITQQSSVGTYGLNDIIGIALDLDNLTISFYKNNSQVGTTINIKPGEYYPAWSDGSQANTFTIMANFGQRAFRYTPPAGFKTLNTTNLKAVGSYNLPDNYGNTLNTPDLVWIKRRNTTSQHVISDTVRGTNRELFSSSNVGEQTNRAGVYVREFTPNGFSIGTGGTGTGDANISGGTYVSWMWNRGKIPGFDIVTYAGDSNNNRMIPHNLGQVPAMYITKNLDGYNAANSFNDWSVWHKGCPTYTGNSRQGKQALWLHNNLQAQNGVGGFFNNPTSTYFGPNQTSYDNVTGHAYIAYLWAEVPGFSKFGTYTGNGLADGPFVYCGFRPAFVLFKSYTNAQDWVIYDTERDTYNPITNYLFADTTATEAPYNNGDYLSNGFKLRATISLNQPYTYIYAAFAEQPFKYANAR